MSAQFRVIIPARYASSRFPGKALADLGGRPMVVRVCEQAAASGAQVLVATDDERIAAAVRAAGYSALRTHDDHASGTDRVAEAARSLRLAEDDVVVNLQGDEPLMPPALIAEVAGALGRDAEVPMATACHPLHDPAACRNSNVVKVVLDGRNRALYFSRAQIPYPREAGGRCFRHVGLYAYRAGFLQSFTRLEIPEIEKTEALEQLRALWHGYGIAVVISERAIPPGVDTSEDLEAVRRMIQ
ncbi:MAG TPA: 3-deoxy-manno-octulosonate cytidylyltransferase [Burkholderiales bacterium]